LEKDTSKLVNITGVKEGRQRPMHYKTRKGFIRKKTVVYCPQVGEQRKFSFNPADFCPICNTRLRWQRS
jgi:hypothetical protein